MPVLLLELNEFSPDLMRDVAEQEGLSNLLHLLSLKASKTHTKDTEERFGLDPWVQWVSIHTGVPSGQHGVKHLGGPPLAHRQLWEVLDEQGVRTGVWGAMNASRGRCDRQAFFFPDPWTFSEQASPSELNEFLAFPRYYAKHYGHLKLMPLLASLALLFKFFLRPRFLRIAASCLPTLINAVVRFGLKPHILFSLFDLMSAKVFLRYYRDSRPDFSILFLNALAHLQHNQWRSYKPFEAGFVFSFKMMDRIAGLLLEAFSDKPIVVANGFSQVNCESADAFLYRQKSPQGFLAAAGVSPSRVEQLMTNDAHVFFDTPDECSKARQILADACIGSQPVFQAEVSDQDRCSLFYQVTLWDLLPDDSLLSINGKTLRFFDFFDVVVKRTGAHVPEGVVLSSIEGFPDALEVHEMFAHIIKHFQADGCSRA